MNSQNQSTAPIQSRLTKLFDLKYPIISGPMFLVSDPTLASSVTNAGGIGAIPSLNWRSTNQFEEALLKTQSLSKGPVAVNLIVNQANPRLEPDLEICVKHKVPLIITSLGNPKTVIQKMHAIGSKVFCDVTELSYAQKVQDLGADGVIAVSAGAGGHAGPTALHVLLPYLKSKISIPIIAAGGITLGRQITAALLLGADGVQIGTRFIATTEAQVDPAYKNAILDANPEDIVLTKRISGTPVSVIQTEYIKKVGTQISKFEEFLLKNPRTKKFMKLARTYMGSRMLQKAAVAPTFKEVWSAGQGCGLIYKIDSVEKVMEELVSEYWKYKNGP